MTLDCMLVSEEKPDRPDTRILATCRLILPCKRHLSVQACFNGLQLADGNCWYSHTEAHYLVAGQVSCSTALPSLLLPAYPPRACPTAATSTSSPAFMAEHRRFVEGQEPGNEETVSDQM